MNVCLGAISSRLEREIGVVNLFWLFSSLEMVGDDAGKRWYGSDAVGDFKGIWGRTRLVEQDWPCRPNKGKLSRVFNSVKLVGGSGTARLAAGDTSMFTFVCFTFFPFSLLFFAVSLVSCSNRFCFFVLLPREERREILSQSHFAFSRKEGARWHLRGLRSWSFGNVCIRACKEGREN